MQTEAVMGAGAAELLGLAFMNAHCLNLDLGSAPSTWLSRVRSSGSPVASGAAFSFLIAVVNCRKLWKGRLSGPD